MTFDDFIKDAGFASNSSGTESPEVFLARMAYEEGSAHFQELLVATLAADFKDEEGALKFERDYPKTVELLKSI